MSELETKYDAAKEAIMEIEKAELAAAEQEMVTVTMTIRQAILCFSRIEVAAAFKEKSMLAMLKRNEVPNLYDREEIEILRECSKIFSDVLKSGSTEG